ncbi:hypothetical protein AWC38_SpisGene20149 [Stylophora pistillata]|uniref:Uncharacterized protein n=1 Tax=Stylophora pistillata TaxID=50429 RepID=A0A2B4REP1_STYPI|nr:hypothetical protein AWC38_SpisGene20149 [Stylophora pistillata]
MLNSVYLLASFTRVLGPVQYIPSAPAHCKVLIFSHSDVALGHEKLVERLDEGSESARATQELFMVQIKAEFVPI